MSIGRSVLQFGVLAVACLACADAPPDDLPADTAVVAANGLWLRQPLGPAEPRFASLPSDPPKAVTFLDIPALHITVAILADTNRGPVAPDERRWRPSGCGLAHCELAVDTMSCSTPMPGTVYFGPNGMLVHLASRGLRDSLGRQRPALLLRRSADPRDGSGADSIPIIYRP